MRTLRWKPCALFGVVALAWWSYAAPIHLVKEIRRAVEEPDKTAASSLLSSRIVFAQVNAKLSGDLRGATQGHLDSASFSHLLLHGWLPQQRPGTGIERSTGTEHTRLYRIRYRDLNRFIAIYWDASQIHEVVLTLQRKSVLHRWYVTRVHQYNVCAYDFDCKLVSSVDSLSI